MKTKSKNHAFCGGNDDSGGERNLLCVESREEEKTDDTEIKEPVFDEEGLAEEKTDRRKTEGVSAAVVWAV